MSEERGIKIYSFLLFLLFVTSMRLWIAWGNRTLIFSFIAFILIVCSILNGIKWNFNRRNILLCILYYSAFIGVSLRGSIQAIYTQIPSYLIPIAAIICINNSIKQKALSNITKWFAIMMIPAIILYLLSKIMTLPSFGLITPDSQNTIRGYGNYLNMIFYVQPLSYHSYFARFNGPFVEPGHLGMMCAFLLFSNLYNLKNKYIIIILIALILSFSLAGYVLAVIGFFFIRYYQGKLKTYRLITYIVLFYGIVLFGQLYNEGENVINEAILSRMEVDEDKGIVGNNRTSQIVTELAANTLSNPKLFLFGYDKDILEGYGEDIMGNGFQLALVRHGILKIIWALSIYFFICYYSIDKKYAYLFLVFLLICYLQRTYPMWFSWIICFYYGICNKDDNYIKQKINK